MIETHVKNKILAYCLGISSCQFGHIPRRGTYLALFNHVNAIVRGIESDQFTVGVSGKGIQLCKPYAINKCIHYGIK